MCAKEREGEKEDRGRNKIKIKRLLGRFKHNGVEIPWGLYHGGEAKEGKGRQKVSRKVDNGELAERSKGTETKKSERERERTGTGTGTGTGTRQGPVSRVSG